MNSFKDHFSGHAQHYASARPQYPPAWFDFLATQVHDYGQAWDAACGNGQAARSLAKHFARVYASDASAEQIRQAPAHKGITYACETAEHCSLADASVDLVSVAQAAHWLDLDGFYHQVRRVGTNRALVALWCYGFNRIDPEIDALSMQLYRQLGRYWPPERALIEQAYRDLPFPFQAIACPDFAIELEWHADDYLAYLRSWSATQRYLKELGQDPVATLAKPLSHLWGQGARRVHWPMYIKLGRIH